MKADTSHKEMHNREREKQMRGKGVADKEIEAHWGMFDADRENDGV